jgi:hypothetical protein
VSKTRCPFVSSDNVDRMARPWTTGRVGVEEFQDMVAVTQKPSSPLLWSAVVLVQTLFQSRIPNDFISQLDLASQVNVWEVPTSPFIDSTAKTTLRSSLGHAISLGERHRETTSNHSFRQGAEPSTVFSQLFSNAQEGRLSRSDPCLQTDWTTRRRWSWPELYENIQRKWFPTRISCQWSTSTRIKSKREG